MAKDGDLPFYGLKEHASVDVNHRFLLATELTPACIMNLHIFLIVRRPVVIRISRLKSFMLIRVTLGNLIEASSV